MLKMVINVTLVEYNLDRSQFDVTFVSKIVDGTFKGASGGEVRQTALDFSNDLSDLTSDLIARAKTQFEDEILMETAFEEGDEAAVMGAGIDFPGPSIAISI